MSTRTLIAVVVTLGVAVAGCGSSKSTTSSSSTASSSAASSSTPGSSTASSSAATSSSSAATGSPTAFKAAFLADRTQLRQLGTSVQKALTQAGAKTDVQLASELTSLGDRAKAQATKLSQLNPPAKFKPTLDKLVSALNKVGDGLHKISTDASSHDAATAKADTIDLVHQATAVKAADNQVSSSLGLS